MNRESDFGILPWEADEYVISFKHKIIGRTLHESQAHTVISWLGTALDQILELEQGMKRIKSEPEVFTSIEQFEHYHFPEDCKRYPLRMRVTQQEYDLVMSGRGGWRDVKEANR